MAFRSREQNTIPAEKTRAFFRNVAEEARALPGVKGAGFASDAPFMTYGDTEGYVVEGEPKLQPGHMNDALYREVSTEYLETVGAEVLEGRLLAAGDRPGGARVIVINEFFAKRHWPGKKRRRQAYKISVTATTDNGQDYLPKIRAPVRWKAIEPTTGRLSVRGSTRHQSCAQPPVARTMFRERGWPLSIRTRRTTPGTFADLPLTQVGRYSCAMNIMIRCSYK